MMSKGWLKLGWRLGLVGVLAGGGAIATVHCTFAQPIPDTALDRNLGTTSQPFNAQIDIIRGGTRPSNGANLFHSFQEFSVQAGHGVYFANPIGVQNILSRVTGGKLSNIQGTVGVLGPANLFLINPSGIIFGPNAALDVRGSFIGTTANAIQLGQAGFFSASDPASSRLLEVNPSALFFNALQTQPIINQARLGVEYTTGRFVRGLTVPTGRSLLLVGGDIRLEGGIIQAPGGRVELSGLSGPGAIGLTQTDNTFQLNIPTDAPLANISLTGSATNPSTPSIVYVAAGGGGSITINASNLDILGESFLQAGIQTGLGTATSRAGDITLNVTEAFRASGLGGVFNIVQSEAIGNAGNIVVNAGSLTVTNGGLINSDTFGQGNAGNVSITVHDAATFDGVGSNGVSSGVMSEIKESAVGQSGKITIAAGALSVTGGAQLRASTLGQGNGGDVTINVRDTVRLDGSSREGRLSDISSEVGPQAKGKGGNVSIRSGSLFVTNGGLISTGTSGQGDSGNITINVRDTVIFDGVSGSGESSAAASQVVRLSAVGEAGNIKIDTQSLFITGGAQIAVGTFGDGDGGTVTINASKSVTLDGAGSNGAATGVFSNVERGSLGEGGEITVNTPLLSISNLATLSSNSFSLGKAGGIVVNADTVQLNNQGIISTSTTLGDGGNITLNARDLILLRHNSQISTTVSSSFEDLLFALLLFAIKGIPKTIVAGDGGNITINSPFIVAISGENSDITANAFRGSGGRVNIATKGIFGLQFRPELTPLSDITASSEFGASGIVTINSPDNSFLQNSLIQFSQTLIDTTHLLTNSCIVRNGQQNGSFTITGSGGLPDRPDDTSISPFPTGEVRSVEKDREQAERQKSSGQLWRTGDPIEEPQGVYQLTSGQLVMSRECDRDQP